MSLLSARILTDVANVNNFRYANQARFTAGDPQTIYFQLLDATQDSDRNPPGRRYVPLAGALVQVTIGLIDQTKQIIRAASQAFPTSDPSIWALTIFSTDQLRGMYDLRFQLTEGLSVRLGVVHNAVWVDPQNPALNTFGTGPGGSYPI